MSFNSYDLATTSLVKTGNLTEMYIPLFYYSSGTTVTASTTGALVQKGSTSTTAFTGVGNIVSSNKLHTLNSNWSTSQKFAFEISTFVNNPSGQLQIYLLDTNTGNSVSASQIISSATTATVLRSGTFNLIPGHSYAIWMQTNNASYTISLTKASLIAFLS